MRTAILLAAASLLVSSSLAAQDVEADQADDGEVLSQQQTFSIQSATPEQWVSRLANASRTLNFSASFVAFQPGSDAVPYIWRHALSESGLSMEHLSLLNGPGREALRIGDKISYFEPDMPPYTLIADIINGPLPGQLLYNPVALQDAYNFVLVGRSRVAGRPAQQLRLISKDKSRFGYSIWLDQETGLLLKANMEDEQGQVIEQVQIVDLLVYDEPSDYFAQIDRASLPEVVNISPSTARIYNWDIGFKPQGMRAIKRDIHRLPITGNIVEYMMLTDGMVDVSVYVQRADTVDEANAALRHQSNTLLTRQVGNVQVTVVGKLPPQTANAIATSVTLASTTPQP
ncbi:MucB/RseB C-terminal domain-containing protein [Aestuariibacter salexigens]|uniref:MucB/RseB C-terminal domain-containing protein n=1 Tax=Aestuariibacter salexigens TaxID=226010 RepID=UPI00041F233C|nr:MucB/RseB C-terminal domain-containing protein [Aestuariibacter salexigens]